MDSQALSPPSNGSVSHDVFLSFIPEDTRKKFIDHLYTALAQAGIHTFREDEELPRGESISPEQVNAIRVSRISVVVFSKQYASSSWCLDELVEILHCVNTRGQTLLPIFYDLDPSDIRKQAGTFGEAFSRHEKRFQAETGRVQKWRAALTEAGNCSGWDLQNAANGYESRLIMKIVEEILYKVNQVPLHVAKHPVGIDPRVEKMKALVNLGTSHDVRTVGIYGSAGIGKTTLAKALYNEICHRFEGSSCLLNITKFSQQLNGLIHLQEQLISDILKRKDLEIGNLDRGINLIKERFCRKRVLIVFDGVENLDHLLSLVGSFEWFGAGSIVIVTTRDEYLPTELRVTENFEIEELNPEESLQLFSWHAFRRPLPIDAYLELSIGAVGYAGGLPLVLEILGSYLLGRSIVEWKSALQKLQKVPRLQIQKELRFNFHY